MKVSNKVLQVMKAEQISAEELDYMVKNAAITSLRDCNRRYFHWCFLIKNGVLLDIQQTDPVEVGEGETRMLEEHEECNGAGCRECRWIGSISRGIRDVTEQVLSNCN